MDLETLKESKYILLKNYFDVNTDWQTVVNLVYKNAENLKGVGPTLWFKIKDRIPFNLIPDLKSFCIKLNEDFGSKYIETCNFNQNWDGRCNCPGVWHIDTPLMSLSSIAMSKHKDLHPAAYIQILGQSFWEIDGQTKITLNPSDLLLLYKGTDHQVWGEGPRFAVLLFAVDPNMKTK
jgi:hypothetical protein